MQWDDFPSLKLLFLKSEMVFVARLLGGCFLLPTALDTAFSQFVIFRSMLHLLPCSPQATSWQKLAVQLKSLGYCSQGSLTLLHHTLGVLVLLCLAVATLGRPG